MSTLLQAVVRAADARTPDADLLARFAQNRDEPAFEELVQRHGPLVWAVCRQLLPHHADAEDAFQAVFLALVRGCGSIRSGQVLPAWLHGVAVRVATKARRSAARRKQREERAAVPEASRPVPDAAWANLMAAVHEEVRRLPEAERTAFVLCDLEGVRQSDAAARLGWTPGTLTGRLCKARQRLIELLTRRGIAPSVLALGGLATSAGTVPAALAAKVLSFPTATAAGVSATVAELARGLVQGVTMRTKLTAAAVLLVGALGLGGGAMLLSNADAQTKGGGSGSPKGLPPGGGGQPKQPEAGNNPFGGPPGTGLPGAGGGVQPPGAAGGLPGPGGFGEGGAAGFGGAGMGMPGMMGSGGGMAVGGRAAVEHKFVEIKGNNTEDFKKAITAAGNDGWEFCGSLRFDHVEWNSGVGAQNNPQHLLVFKRHKGGAVSGGVGMGSMLGMSGGGGRGGSGGGTLGGVGGFGGLGGGGYGGGDLNNFRVIKLTDANADDVVAALKKAFPTANIRAVAEHASNSVVIVSAGSASMKEINELIERLDVKPGAGPKTGGSSMSPRPGSSGPPGAGTGAGSRPPAGGGPGAMGPMGGSASVPPPGMSMPGGGGSPPDAGGVHVIALKHANANDLAIVIQQVFPGRSSVTPEPRTNQLIVRANQDTLLEMAKLIDQLDVEAKKR